MRAKLRFMRLPNASRSPRGPVRSRRLRFGCFEFDPNACELKGPNGAVRLQPQPARLLELLLENSGDVVSRERVRRHLWPNEVHVEFDQSMNTCVKRIRSALNDSAEKPRFIETLPRLGYRFLAPVTEVGNGPFLAVKGGSSRRPPRSVLLALLTAAAIVAAFTAWRALTAPPCDEDPAPQLGDVDEAVAGRRLEANLPRSRDP